MLNTFPKAYLYIQYNDDADLQAMVDAYNIYAQSYLDAFNALGLPDYTRAPVEGPLLDWVGTSLYGIPRPVFGTTSFSGEESGVYNQNLYDEVVYDGDGLVETSTFTVATDDQYRRAITWNFFKGDGFQFNATWLKRRVLRFLTGTDGIDPGIQETYQISVVYGANRLITIAPSALLPNIPLLAQGIAGGQLALPLQFTYAVTTS